jgi:hypothetical protein
VGDNDCANKLCRRSVESNWVIYRATDMYFKQFTNSIAGKIAEQCGLCCALRIC